MLGESNGPALAGIRPAPLCKEYGRKSRRMVASASNLPSLARLGMFKATNDSKSRFIHKHMKMATAETLEPQTAVEIGVEEWLQPRHWGAPADISIKRVSEPLGVMSTEKGLEEYRRNKREQKRQARQQPEVRGNRGRGTEHFRQSGVRIPANRRRPYPASSGFHLRNDRANQPPISIVRAPKRGSGFAGVDGIMKRSFPRIAESGDAGSVGSAGNKFGAGALGKREGEVVRRLCDPKLFTGTAATGHLPTTVDLEGGVGVLLKDAPIAVKDHVGAQEVSWRLRLAERL